MMGWRRRRRTLVELVLALSLLLGVSYAEAATTQVTETVYHADGTAAAGTLLVSWPSFTAADGSSVPAGSTSVTIGAGGAVSTSLVPNAGATPMGTYYTVVYHLDDGSTAREYWVVPVSAYPVQVSAIKSSVLPLSVAMQTVSKAYVDTAIATAMTGHPLDSSTPYVLKTGDTMTGPLQLPGDPTSSLQASDKQYVDEQTAALTAGLGQKVSELPAGGQTVAQPAGTTLAVNDLNGELYASQYASSAGNDGIAGAVANASCASGCEVKAEPTYGAAETVAPATWNSQTHVSDARGGAVVDTYLNPENPHAGGNEAAQTVHLVSTRSSADLKASEGVVEPFSYGLSVEQESLAGGSNLFPQLVQGSVPYFKTTYTALQAKGTHSTLGQHVLAGLSQTCYAVGDCLIGGQFLTSSGGFRDDGDEGTHPFDLEMAEDTRVFEGTCASGCAAGSTSVQIAATANAGTQGEGRYLIDTNPAKVLTGGVLTGGSNIDPVTGGVARQPSASFTGTSFPVSVLLETAGTIPTQANDVRPGTVTVTIATGSVPAGFQTSTAALPTASGVACVTDMAFADQRALNYEMAAYTTVDGSHLRMTLNKPHSTGATIAVGGLCGYGLEQTVDTAGGIRQVFPVVASTSATTLLYAGGSTPIVGVQSNTSAYLNVNATIASVSRSANVVTVTTAGNLPVDVNGLTLTVAGVADSSFNGSFAVTSTGPNTFTFAQSGSNAASTGGSATLVTGGYALYPMAEVLTVFNTATKAIDGQMTLAANNVAWAAGDTVEQPHYFQQSVLADTEYIQQTTPRPERTVGAGISYAGNNGPGLNGWQVTNLVPASQYLGNGGTHTTPDAAFQGIGVWKRSMSVQAGDEAAFAVHCNSHGCGRWDSTYNLFELDSNVGIDTVQFAPTTSTLSFNLRGTQYSMSPTALTAGTINASVINAGAVHGAIAAASLPVFIASGSGHATGAVPDPGPSPGATRFLREDGSWSVPVGTGGGSGGGSGSSSPMAAEVTSSVLPTYFNYFDPSRATLNTIVSTTDGSVATGFTGWYSSALIPVQPGHGYSMAKGTAGGSGSYGLAWYDGTGAFVSGVNLPFSDGQSFIAPGSAAFVRFSGQTTTVTTASTLATQMWTEGLTPGMYVAFAPALGADPTNLGREAAAIQTAVEAYLPGTLNLFDAATATLNTIVAVADGTTTSFSGWYASGYIPVKQATAYTMAVGTGSASASAYGLAWYDENRVYLGGVPLAFTSPQTFTSPAGAAYMRFSGLIANSGLNMSAQMIVEGSTLPTSYVRSLAAKINGSLAGVRVGLFGDSITGAFNQQWQQTFFGLTGATYQYQNARGGRKFAQAFEFYGNNPSSGTNDGGAAAGFTGPTGYGGTSQMMAGTVLYDTGTVGNTLAQDLASVDLVICFLGTNDGPTTLGAYGDSASTATLYGEIAAFENGVHAANPNARVLFVTPYQTVSYVTVAQTKAIVQAIQQVAADYGDAVLDLRSTSGIGSYNAATYLQSDGTHPTALGFARIGQEIAQFAQQWYAR